MKALHSLAERIRRGDPIPLPIAGLLSAATPLVRLGMAHRLRRPRVRVGAHVVSFGNITAGGTGKTPAVIERVRCELSAGKRVAVLTRGYGTSQSRAPIAAESAAVDLSFGDEPALIARKAPGVVIVKGVDRVAAAQLALNAYGCDTLVLDDGFQYVQLERDENIVLIDAANPFGNGRLIPRGILREPVSHLSRATAVVLTRCDQVADVGPLQATVHRLCPDVSVRCTRHAPASLWQVSDGVPVALDLLQGASVCAVCGIGNPEAFYQTLEFLGAAITHRMAYPDHASIPREAFSGAKLVVTTEKDAVRLAAAPANVLALGVELRDLLPS